MEADTEDKRIFLSREVSPETIETEDLGIFRSLEKNLIKAEFALPSTGGALSEIFNRPLKTPVKPVFFAPG